MQGLNALQMWKTLEFVYFNHFTLANDVSQELLHLEFQSNNFLLALTETNKKIEMTGCESESVIGDAAEHILECLEWLWNCGRSAVFSFKTENQFLVFLIFI